MRRDTSCHTDCDSIRTIYKQVRDSHRKYHRFLLRLIKVRHEINHILIQIFKKYILCQFLKSGFCISHSRCTVALDRTKISMSVDQRLTFLKILCHYYKCLIDGAVTMRVIFTHGITYDTGTFSVWPIITDSQFIHIIQCSSLYRFQSVTHIRQGSGDNNTHGVIDIGFLHDLRIVGGDYILLFCFHLFHSSVQIHTGISVYLFTKIQYIISKRQCTSNYSICNQFPDIRYPVPHPVHAHR